MLCTLAWISLNVWGNYGSYLSGLFYTGATVALPPALDGDATFRVREDVGYDAQFCRLAAHDPLFVALQLAFVFAGAWWLARFAESARAPAAWGVAFLLILPRIALQYEAQLAGALPG